MYSLFYVNYISINFNQSLIKYYHSVNRVSTPIATYTLQIQDDVELLLLGS